LREGAERLGRGDLGELDDRFPELADQSQGDLVLLAALEQHPPALAERHAGQFA
jgi:hypothetical protein